MKRVQIIWLVRRFVLFALLWLVLTGGALEGLLIGALAAGIAAWSSLKLLPIGRSRVSVIHALLAFPGYLRNSFLGGVDVAYRALHPRMPLNTGWIAFQTKLPGALPRLTLSSETTLLPGSLVAGSRGDTLYVHCLDTTQDVAASLGTEEKRIARTLVPAKGEDA